MEQKALDNGHSVSVHGRIGEMQSSILVGYSTTTPTIEPFTVGLGEIC
jgi:hypothetical protein